MNLFENINGSKQVKSVVDVLDQYKDTLTKFLAKIEKLEAEKIEISKEDQMAAVQVALDLTYLKEELDVMKPSQDLIVKEMQSVREMLENDVQLIMETQGNDRQFIEETLRADKLSIKEILERITKIDEDQRFLQEKISGLSTDIIEPIKSNYTANRNAVNDKLDEVMEVVQKGNGKVKTALIVSLILNVIMAGGLIFNLLLAFGIIA